MLGLLVMVVNSTPYDKLPNVVFMLAHRLRPWPSIKTTLGEGPVFSGLHGMTDSVKPSLTCVRDN